MRAADVTPYGDHLLIISPARKGRLLQLAELQQAHEALTLDITLHEKVRATVDERLAEAKAHRALIAAQMRALRGAPPL